MGNCNGCIRVVETAIEQENKRLNTYNIPPSHKIGADNTIPLLAPLECNRVPDKNISIKECEEYVIPLHIGRVGKVYDVDTITLMFYVNEGESNYKLYKKSCRIFGIDGPELKSKNKYEKKIAIKGQRFLEQLIMGKIVTLKNNKNDKYGRILADVYLDNVKISDILLEQNLVVTYDGKKKRCPKNWVKFHKYGKMK